jgi:hypothetical protein
MGALSLLLLSTAAATSAPSPRPAVTAHATATVTIVTPALIGAAYGPPAAMMTARDATVALPGGGSTVIRLYEFE